MAVNRYYSSSAIDTTLQDGIDASATEIKLASTAGMPQSYPFTLAIGFDLSTEEIVNVVGAGSVANSYKVGTTVGTASVTGRGVDGSTAQSHAAGVAVKHVFTARDMREAQEHIDATGKYTVTNGSQTEDQDLHGIGAGEGVVVGTAKTQTLTNKTISGANNTITAIPQASITNLTSDLALKAPLASPTFTGTVTLPTGTVTSGVIADGTIVNADINASAAIDWTKLAISSTVSATELGYVDGVTSSIQTQLDSKIDRTYTVQSAKTGAYTIADGDQNDLIQLSGTFTVSIPTDATFNFPVGTTIDILNIGTGTITVAAVNAGVTAVNATPGLKLRAQWSAASLIKRAANTWVVVGDLTA